MLDTRRRMVRKWGSPTLGELGEWHRERQVVRTAWNFFKDGYDTARHRQPPAGVQRPDGIRYNPPSWDDPHHRAWLAAFLADEPAWRPRLERWIDEAG